MFARIRSRTVVACDRSRHRDHPGARGGIGRVTVQRRMQRAHRRHVHDAPAMPRRAHQSHALAHQQERCALIEGVLVVEEIERRLEQVAVAGDTSAVDEDVEPPEPRLDLFEQCHHRRLGLDVGRDGNDVFSGRIDAARESLGSLGVNVCDDDARASGRQYGGDVRAGAGAAVSDDGDLSVDPKQCVERGRHVGHVKTSRSTQFTCPGPKRLARRTSPRSPECVRATPAGTA